MTKIKPLRAIIYNQEKTKDLSRLTCPPYDIISPAKQQYYHDLSPYNLIHVLLGKDISGEDKYRRAAAIFKDWLKNKILLQEDNPGIYFYSQQYKIQGETKTRFGLIALLRLDDKEKSVFGHEHTHSAPKTDRFNLIRQVKANLSPIFVLFADKKRIIQKSLESVQDKVPDMEVTDDEKTVHKVWRLDEPDLLDKIQSAMEKENIFIADGHHRYEVACAYRDEMRKKSGSFNGEEGFNYVLSYFTNIESRGLSILPIHRLVKLNDGLDLNPFKDELKKYFHLEEIKDPVQFWFLLKKAGRTEHVLGMYAGKKFWLLRLKNIKILDKIMSDKPAEHHRLDVSILNAIVFNQILNLSLEDKESIIFGADAEEFFRKSDSDARYIAFFLNPVKVQQIVALSLKGEKMPPKSTYFYPKVLSGLVMHKHQNG